MASKYSSLRLKREKDDLENNLIQQGKYTKDNLSVYIDDEEHSINIMYMPNEDMVYEFYITVPKAFPFAVPVLHYMKIEEYDADGNQKIIKKSQQSWASISPNASRNNIVLNQIDDLMASWRPDMKLRNFIPKILDIVIPVTERYQADEKAKREKAAKVIQKKYTDARSWLPGQKRISNSFAPPSIPGGVGGSGYEAIKDKYAPQFTSGQKEQGGGGKRRKRKKTKRRKRRRKRKTLKRRTKSKKH